VEADNVYDPNWQAPPGVQRFKLSELSSATGGFDKAHEIGVGGFGKVFIGNFKDGRTLAIKRASGLVSSNQGLAEFRNEVSVVPHLSIFLLYTMFLLTLNEDTQIA